MVYPTRAMPLAIRLPIREPHLRKLFFEPIRFCGRSWRKLDQFLAESPANKIMKLAAKVIGYALLGCASALAAPLALVGAFLFPLGYHSHTASKPVADGVLLWRSKSEEEVKKRIETRISAHVHGYTVKVASRDRTVINDYFPDTITREITISRNSSRLERACNLVLSNFLENGYPLLDKTSLHDVISFPSEETKRDLENVLSLSRQVTFRLAFDLAYLITEIN